MSLAASPARAASRRDWRRPVLGGCGARRSADAAPRHPLLPAMSLAASRGGAGRPPRNMAAGASVRLRADRPVTAGRVSRQPDAAHDEGPQVAVAVSPWTPERRAHPARSRDVPGDATRGPQGRARPATDRPGRRPRATPAPAGKRPPGVAIGRSMPPARPWPSRRRGPASAHHTTCPLSATCARRVMRGPHRRRQRPRRPGARRVMRGASSPLPATAPPWRPPGDARGLIVDGSDFSGLPETRETAGIHVSRSSLPRGRLVRGPQRTGGQA